MNKEKSKGIDKEPEIGEVFDVDLGRLGRKAGQILNFNSFVQPGADVTFDVEKIIQVPLIDKKEFLHLLDDLTKEVEKTEEEIFITSLEKEDRKGKQRTEKENQRGVPEEMEEEGVKRHEEG